MPCTSYQVVIFPHLKRGKVPVSNSAEFLQNKCPLEDFDGFGVVRVTLNNALTHVVLKPIFVKLLKSTLPGKITFNTADTSLKGKV